MKKILFTLSIIIVLIISAGCIGNSSDNNQPDKIIGTWITQNHTNSEGVHYSKIVDTYYENFTMSEVFYLDDGRTINSKGIWMKEADGNYSAYNYAVTFKLSPAGDIGIVNSDLLNIEDMTFIRTGGNSGFAGSWKNKEPYEFNTGCSYIEIMPNADGTGKTVYLDENNLPETPLDFTWVEVGEDFFVMSFSKPMYQYINEEGNICDNFGLVYTKAE
ncbi:MAG: hypothetical protein Q4Q53_07845 [Methanocorpusculum sp.]|nr:hypothetical protein [Methanocorpusculum sp.]